jgi:hypothetical protein
MPREDLSIFRELGERAAELTDLHLLPTIDYRSADQPPVALKGHSADWGYQHLGLFHFEVEQGNVYNAAGVKTEDFFAAGSEGRHEFLHDAIRYHDRHPEQEMFVDWHEVDHPQLGPVEIGGWKKYWMINPSFETLQQWIAPGSARFIMEYAARRPRLEFSELTVDGVADDLFRVRARVMNTGVFPTNITQRGLQLRALRPIAAELVLPEGVELLSETRHFSLGHLGPNAASAQLEWFIRCAPGTELTLRARSQKSVPTERSFTC